MEKTPEYCALDAVLPNLQEAAVSLDPACRSSRELQGWTRPGDDIEETMSTGGEMLSGELKVA